jgi:hypothetical protein
MQQQQQHHYGQHHLDHVLLACTCPTGLLAYANKQSVLVQLQNCRIDSNHRMHAMRCRTAGPHVSDWPLVDDSVPVPELLCVPH